MYEIHENFCNSDWIDIFFFLSIFRFLCRLLVFVWIVVHTCAEQCNVNNFPCTKWFEWILFALDAVLFLCDLIWQNCAGIFFFLGSLYRRQIINIFLHYDEIVVWGSYFYGFNLSQRWIEFCNETRNLLLHTLRLNTEKLTFVLFWFVSRNRV